MRQERVLVAIVLLIIAGGLAWGAAGLFRRGRAAPTAGPYLGGLACGAGAAFMGVWALNLLAA